MNARLFGIVVLVAALALPIPVFAGSVKWFDTTGAFGSFAAGASWDNLQTAITNAQGGGGGGRGEVRIEGDIVRTNSDLNYALSVAAGGNVDITGGWDGTWTTENLATRSLLNSASGSLTNRARVVSVDAPSVKVGNLWLKNGYSAAAAGAGLYATANASGLRVANSIISNNGVAAGQNGGGVYVGGANDVKISNTIIANNSMGGRYGSGGGGGIMLNNAGTAAAPVVLEYCHIGNNTGGSDSNGYGNGLAAVGTTNAMVANSRISNNEDVSAGDAVYSNATKLVLFGTLIDSHTMRDSWGPATARSSQIVIVNNNADAVVMANSTVADNGNGQVYVVGQTDGDRYPPLLINSLVGTSNPSDPNTTNEMYVNNNNNYNYSARGHDRLQNTTLSAGRTAYTLDGVTTVNDLPTALNTTGQGGQYRFHSLDANGNQIVNPGSDNNFESTIGFVTTDSLGDPDILKRSYKCQLLLGDTSTSSAITKSGGTYAYVDIDHDNVFDPALDVVIAGAAPQGALFYYPYDLSFLGRVTYNPGTGLYSIEAGTCLATGLDPLALGYLPNRLQGEGLERGVYELVAPVPEPPALGLLLLGLPLVIRRRRA